ncbi:hypothetical protein [Vibrio parahaemolyticus]
MAGAAASIAQVIFYLFLLSLIVSIVIVLLGRKNVNR